MCAVVMAAVLKEHLIKPFQFVNVSACVCGIVFIVTALYIISCMHTYIIDFVHTRELNEEPPCLRVHLAIRINLEQFRTAIIIF